MPIGLIEARPQGVEEELRVVVFRGSMPYGLIEAIWTAISIFSSFVVFRGSIAAASLKPVRGDQIADLGAVCIPRLYAAASLKLGSGASFRSRLLYSVFRGSMPRPH